MEKQFLQMNTEEMCQAHMEWNTDDFRSIELLRDAAKRKLMSQPSQEIQIILENYILWANKKMILS